MSHAVVIVMANSMVEVEELMEPYSESLEVDGYEEDCYCVSKNRFKDADDYLKEKTGETWEEARTRFGLENTKPEFGSKEWKKMDKKYKDEIYIPRRELEEDFYANQYKPQPPDPDCTECHGTGKVISTYNPDSKWDWYEEGGRFFDYKPPRSKSKATLENMPFAILTESDGWLETAELGWWGMTSKDKDYEEWKETYFDAYNRAIKQGKKPFVIDFHI
jgi:hypothetical protein